MKCFILFISAIAVTTTVQAQNVGINNSNPLTALDIEGRLRLRPEAIVVSTGPVVIPESGKGYYTLNGSPVNSFVVTLPSGTPGSFILLENATSRIATVTGLARIHPGKSRLFLNGQAGWMLANDTESQLEKVTEGANTGWRLLDRPPVPTGQIGNYALDLSTGSVSFPSSGAEGLNSLATGFSTNARGRYASALNYRTTADGDYSTSMGYLSLASGQVATALGSNTLAANQYATALGYLTTAIGIAATSMGIFTVASGESSTAMGRYTTARSFSSVAIGQYNDSVASSNPLSWVPADPLFIIGNGTSSASRSNAVTVYKNGNTDLNGFTRLGSVGENAPRIKVIKLTTTLNGSSNGNIVHGLQESKILEVAAKVTNQFGSMVFDGNNLANNAFNVYLNAGSVVIAGAPGNSNDLVNRPVLITITYEE